MSILNEDVSKQVRDLGSPPSSGTCVTEMPKYSVSYISGSKEVPLAFLTIPQLIQESVSRFGPKTAVVFSAQGIRRSYYDLDREIDELATGLLALGLEKGDRLGIWSPNRYEWLLTQFATARIGVVLVNINPAYGKSELAYALNKVGCKALIAAEKFKKSNYLKSIRELVPELEDKGNVPLISKRLPALKYVIALCDEPGAGMLSFRDIVQMGGPQQQLRLAEVDATLDPDEAINIQFTSGTTGAPKGATLSHYNIINNACFSTDRIAMTENDILCVPVPLYHCFGMVLGAIGSISKGATLVFPDEGFDPHTCLLALERERCTAVYGVPTMFIAMLDEISTHNFDLSAMRTGVMAGAPCPVDVMHRVIDQMHMKEVTICYGMTETSPVSFQSKIDDSIENRCETVGTVHPHVEAKIVDKNGILLPLGVQGELCIRGYSVMKGYWDDEEKTKKSITDGWIKTGDLAQISREGFCTITGRVKDMIIRGGENVYPREVEDFLFGHPKIGQVQVFGIPSKPLGEEVCAWIIPAAHSDLNEDEVRDYCRGQIAHYKVPKHIKIVADIPMTATGKPQKFKMRDAMVKLFK